MSSRWLLFIVAAVLVVSACSKKSEDDREAQVAAEQAAQSAAPVIASLPTAEGPAVESLPSGGTEALPTASAEFDPSSVPVTTVSLPPFPLFKDPEGQKNQLAGSDALISFDRHYFIAGNKIRAEEGKIALASYSIDMPQEGRRYTPLEFHRNYANAVSALGGQEISTTQFTDEVVSAGGGREAIEKYLKGASPVPDHEHHSYLIRSADKEYWIHVSTGAIPLQGYVTVLEKQAMQSSIAFVDAAAMKKKLDADGRIALYINFDIDKATLRPDAQPIIAEINKLLVENPALKLSIEGHTDNTGTAARNRELSGARARTVFGALVGMGIDPARLSSSGFGPDKPIADNASEDGRAKNRRVELVKVE